MINNVMFITNKVALVFATPPPISTNGFYLKPKRIFKVKNGFLFELRDLKRIFCF
jgi:hypothetical protein